MRVLLVGLTFAIALLPAVAFATETLGERLFAELRLINEFNVKLATANEEFIQEWDSESCVKTSTQGAAPMSPSCKEQSLQHLAALDENNRTSTEYVTKVVEGWARIYGMLRVGHMHCGHTSLDFEAVPAFLSKQASVINKDADALILMYIEAAESALAENLGEVDCQEIQSFTITIQRIMIEARRAIGKMR